MSIVRRVGKNFILMVTAEIISRFIIYFIIIFIARKFGTASFGNLSFAQVFIGYAVLFSDFGLTTLAIRDVSREKEKTVSYISNIIRIRLLIGLILFLLILFYVSLGQLSIEVKPLLILYGLGLIIMSLDINWVFQAHEQMKYNSLLKIINQVIYLASLLILFLYSHRLIVVPVANLVGLLSTVILGWGLYYKYINTPNKSSDPINWKRLINEAYPIGISTLMCTIYMNFDTIFLNYMKGPQVTGWYSAAYKIIILLLTITTVYNIVMLPVLARGYQQNILKVTKIVNYSIKLLIAVAIPLTFGGILVAGELITFIYGPQFINAVPGLQILLVIVIIIFITTPLNLTLLACNCQKKLTQNAIFGAVINTLLNLILIPKYSLAGAGISTVITELFILILAYKNVKKIIEVQFFTYLIKPVASALFMIIFLNLIMPAPLYLIISLGALIYLITLILLKGIGLKDWQIIKQLFINNISKQEYQSESSI